MALRLKTLFKLFLFISICCSVSAQIQQENSPFSTFGLGDLIPQNHDQYRSMGYTAYALRSNKIINFQNPASLSNLDYTTLQTGVFINGHWLRNNLSSSDTSYINNSSNGSLSYLSLAVPVGDLLNRDKRGKINYNIAFSLTPYTRTSYDVLSDTESESLPEDQNRFVNRFIGNGEFYNLYISQGYATPINKEKEGFLKYNQLSLGTNLIYYFGTRSTILTSSTPEIPSSLGTFEANNLSLNDFGYNVGLQFTRFFYKTLKNNSTSEKEEQEKETKEYINSNFTFGFTYQQENNLNARRDFIRQIVRTNGIVATTPISTIEEVEDEEGIVVLPEKIGFGLSYSFDRRFTIAADFTNTKWNELSVFEETNLSLVESQSYNLGFSAKPKISLSSLTSVWKRSTYRFGGYYNTNHINVNGEISPDFGATVGINFPVFEGFQAQRLADVGISLNIGKRGSFTEGNINETYFKATLGFTFNDGSWFLARKYD